MLPLSNPLTSPEKPRKTRSLAPVLDILNPSRTNKPPHIRTPSTSRSPANTPSSLLSSMSALPRTAGLPRGLTRLLIIVLAVGSIVGLVHISRGGVEEGLWDASSYADRRGSSPHTRGGLGAVKKKIERLRLTNPIAEEPAIPASGYGIPRRPSLARENITLPRPIHTGVSRKAVIGSPDKYTTAPLPTIDEAWAWLHPKLRDIKRKVPSIPREHQLWNPLFNPALTEEMKLRYTHLRMDWDEEQQDWVPATKRYYFVTLCRQVAGMLADWFAAWTVLVDYLGPESIYFSLHEGDSADGTGEIISGILRDYLLFLGVPPENIYIRTFLPKVDWEAAHRIELLADMRNQAMKPLYDSAPEGLSPDGHPWSAVIWYNDVYLSGTHFLELLHQHFMQDADMSCGWDHAGRWFYDGWVGRDMSGDLYTPFPVKEEDKDLPQKLFINHWPTKARFDRLLPFQVFAGWNGVTVINPTPFFPPYNVRFRRGAKAPPTGDLTAADMECQASESSFISWDFWKYGFGRIQTVPGIHACYGKEDAQMRGWVEFPNPDDEEGYSEMIQWQDQPPARVRCHDWPDKPGKGYWAWDTVRWVPPPEFVKVTAD